jgi:hypothetical protein
MTLWPLLARFVHLCTGRRIASVGTMQGERLIDRQPARQASSAGRTAITAWYEEEPGYLKTATPKNIR